MTPRDLTGFEGFSYARGELFCEQVGLATVAAEVGTPVYVYSKAAIVNRVRRLQDALGDKLDCGIHFAVKACGNIHLLGLLRQLGCGADIVSGGELFRAALARIPPDRIVFSGVGKGAQELSEALKAGILVFNVESVGELELLDRLAREAGARTRISLRINPDVDPKTHPHIATGLRKNKFGLSREELALAYRRLPELKNVAPLGLSCHIGSQITKKGPFLSAWKALFAEAGRAPFKVTHLDLGGGLGIPYEGERALELEDYGRMIRSVFEGRGFRLAIEPGRALTGPTAALLTRLVVSKKRRGRSIHVVDAAMNDLIRPALYGSIHPLLPVSRPRSKHRAAVDIVGPVCESADTFQTGARLPKLGAEALLAFGNAGAYGMSMASQYNARPRPAEVLVDRATYQVIRKRETYADLVGAET